MSQKDEKQLSVGELKELLVCYDGGNLQYLSEHRAAQILNVTRRTLKTLLENRKAIESHREENADGTRVVVAIGGGRPTAKRPRKNGRELLDDVETGLLRCFRETVAANSPANDAFLLDAAGRIAARLGAKDFVPTVTWLMHWKYKNNIPLEHTAAAVPRSDAFDVSATKKWLDDLLRYAAENYRAGDVYGLVETGLYHPTAVDDGRQLLVHRVSVVFMCNVTGTDKKQPLVIDCNDRRDSRPNALMTSYYTSSLLKWDREMGSRKILLVLDNRSVHPKLCLRNIDVKYLPKCFTHPLGQNIVRIAKTYERHRNVTSPTAQTPCFSSSWKHTTSEYLNMLSASWADVSPELIRDCFRTIGFATSDDGDDVQTTGRHSNGGHQARPHVLSEISCPEVDEPRSTGEGNPNVPLDLTRNRIRDGQLLHEDIKNDDDDDIPTPPVMYGSGTMAVGGHSILRTLF